MDEISRTPNTVLAYGSKARTVLVLLGFSGFSQFSRYCGCNHQTVSDLLYRGRRRRKKFSNVARIYEALVGRYREREKLLQKNERIYSKGWINQWIKNIADNIDDFVVVDAPGKQCIDPNPAILRQRLARAAKKRALYLKTLEFLK